MATSYKTALNIVFGAMTIGKAGVEQARVHDLKDAGALLDIFQKFGHNEIDTARVYGEGSSEEYLGELEWQKRGIIMDTKYYPLPATVKEGHTHSPKDLRENLLRSLRALKTDKIDMWYLHAPDRTVPYEETMKEVNNLYEEGYFNRFGLSNYMSWEVAQIQEICIKNGWIRPCVYQGVYNAIHRAVEPELFPCLRHYGMAFYAFNPLAGGYLTNRYHRDSNDDVVEKGSRFDPNTRQGKSYRNRYWKDEMFRALDIIRQQTSKHGLTEAECALRWISHHSLLKRELKDAIIIGASSVKHLTQNLTDLEKGPLPDDVVEALDSAWAVTKGVTTPYYH
ncbi:NADP-dependent oxidoreductase domain-containing protein [Dipodascopsis uninucleata]